VTVVNVQELIDAGVHFGHQARRWNPKMKPFIYGKRHKIHIIDLKATIRGLYQASHFLRSLASTGAEILFVGTKRQIRSIVDAEARRCGMPAITERWIGGTLTNFSIVRERLGRLEELEAMEADGTMERHKKKAQAMLRREMRKIQRNLEGLRMLHGLPGALVVVDPRREENAMKEAARMNVPVVAILDTDCDPDLADIVIPANDDAMSSVQILISRLADAILEGRGSLDEQSLIAAQRSAADDPRAREVVGRRSAGPGPGDRRGGGRRRPRPPGGRLGRRATGRSADRAAGHAATVSVGGDAAAEASARAPASEAAAPASEAAAPASESQVVESRPAATPPEGGQDPAPPSAAGTEPAAESGGAPSGTETGGTETGGTETGSPDQAPSES